MGTYNYPARELADEINTMLDNLEGDFQIDELEKALRLVAVEQKRALDGVYGAQNFRTMPDDEPPGSDYRKSSRRK